MDSSPKTHAPPAASTAAVVSVTLALIASSVEPLVVKLGYGLAATAVQLLVLKLLFGALFMAPVYRKLRWVGWPGLGRLALASALFVGTNVLLFSALERLPAAVVITVIATTPAVVALFNRAWRREQVGPRFWVGFALCLLGVALTIDLFSTTAAALSGAGIALAFGTVVASSMYRTRMDELTAVHGPLGVCGYLFLMNALWALAAVPWLRDIPPAAWGLTAWLGLVAAVANVAFLSALHLLGSTRISILTVLQRPLVIVAAALWFDEPLGLAQIAGIAMVLVGVQQAKAEAIPRPA